MCQTATAMRKVTSEPSSVASQAESRSTASSTSSTTTGTSATSQLANRFPSGSTICVNMTARPPGIGYFIDELGANAPSRDASAASVKGSSLPITVTISCQRAPEANGRIQGRISGRGRAGHGIGSAVTYP
jgi:hypothetical protein